MVPFREMMVEMVYHWCQMRKQQHDVIRVADSVLWGLLNQAFVDLERNDPDWFTRRAGLPQPPAVEAEVAEIVTIVDRWEQKMKDPATIRSYRMGMAAVRGRRIGEQIRQRRQARDNNDGDNHRVGDDGVSKPEGGHPPRR